MKRNILKMKKVILITNTPSKSGLAYFHYLAFRDMPGVSVEIIDNGQATYGRTIAKRLVSRVRHQLNIDKAEQYKTLLARIGNSPEEICVILYGLACLSPLEIRTLHGVGVKLYAYFSDAPFAIPLEAWGAIRSALPLFRSVFVPTRDLVPVYYQNGAARVLRVPFGYCRYTHLRSTSQLPGPEGKIYYFGTYGPLIEKWLAPLSNLPLVIHGHDWGRATCSELRSAAQHPVALDANMASQASGQLVVNFMRTQHGGCHSMKTFELPAAGACVVSNHTNEQIEFFPEESCITYFNTAAELGVLVSKFMSKPEEIAGKIGLRERYLDGQSYHERIGLIMKELEVTFD